MEKKNHKADTMLFHDFAAEQFLKAQTFISWESHKILSK